MSTLAGILVGLGGLSAWVAAVALGIRRGGRRITDARQSLHESKVEPFHEALAVEIDWPGIYGSLNVKREQRRDARGHAREDLNYFGLGTPDTLLESNFDIGLIDVRYKALTKPYDQPRE